MNLRQTQDILRDVIVDEYLATACGDSRPARRRFRSIKKHGLPDVNTMAERLPKKTRHPDDGRRRARRHVKPTVHKRKKTVEVEIEPVETVKKYTTISLGGWV